MGKNERYAYLLAVRDRYRQASKRSKAIILDEFCQVCGYKWYSYRAVQPTFAGLIDFSNWSMKLSK